MSRRREQAPWAVLIALLVVLGVLLAYIHTTGGRLQTITTTVLSVSTRTTTVTTTLTKTATMTTTITRTLTVGENLAPRATRPPLVLTYFYLWYGVESEDQHWNDSPLTTVVDEPLLGRYNSSDPHTLDVQLAEMEAAGFDGAIVSWWGPGSPSDRALRVLMRLLETRVAGPKIAVMIEPYLGNDPASYTEEWWRQVLGYLERNYIAPHRDKYLHLHGKPLILAFSPVGEAYDPRGAFENYTIRLVGGADWYLWPHNDTSLAGILTIARDGYVALTPRIDTSHMARAGAPKENVSLDPDLSQGWYINQWLWVLGRRGNISIVAVYSWNEYHERSQIEPYRDGETGEEVRLLYDLTRTFIAVLKQDHLLMVEAGRPDKELMEQFLEGLITCTGLLRATPHTDITEHNRSYTVSDNVLAFPVLSVASPKLAAMLIEALWRYGNYNNGIHPILVLGSGANYTLATTDALVGNETQRCGILIYATTARSEPLAWLDYADRVVYAILNKTVEGDLSEAYRLFREALIDLWDGYGFNDTAAREKGRYDTYKLALAIYAYRMLGALDPSFAAEYRDLAETWMRILMQAQDEHGGLRTEYWAVNGDIVFEDTCNVETTAMAYLALYTNYPLLLAWSSPAAGS